MSGFTDLAGQGFLQLGELTLAFVLSALVGLEREIRQKAAGLRTTTLVGVASGIGFIGGGVIFMRRDLVRGLTTAASVWLTAALGMACGAGLPVLAVATTLGHFVIMLGFPVMVRRLKRHRRTVSAIHISYADGRGLLRTILVRCTELRFAIDQVRLSRPGGVPDAGDQAQDALDEENVGAELADARVASNGGAGGLDGGLVSLHMQVIGKRPVSHLVAGLVDIDGVAEVGVVDGSDLD